jgi:hypothetical protein
VGPGVEPGIAAEELDDVKLAKLHSRGRVVGHRFVASQQQLLVDGKRRRSPRPSARPRSYSRLRGGPRVMGGEQRLPPATSRARHDLAGSSDRHWASGNDDLSCRAVKRDASAISRHDLYGLAEWVVGSTCLKN